MTAPASNPERMPRTGQPPQPQSRASARTEKTTPPGQSTVARTPEEARQAAEEIAKRHGTQVTVLAPVALCDGGVVPRWTQDFPQVPFGWSTL